MSMSKFENVAIVIGLTVSFLAVPLRFAGSTWKTSEPATAAFGIDDGRPALYINLFTPNLLEAEDRATAEVIRPSTSIVKEAKVTLRSSVMGAKPEPQELTIPAGEVAATFSVQITPNPADRVEAGRSFSATITASSPGYSSGNAKLTRGGMQDGALEPRPRTDIDRLLAAGADAAALAGVVFLCGACLLAFGTTSGGHPIPPRVRFSCMLGVLIALPSAVSNAVASSDTFWLVVTFCLLTISVTLLVGHLAGHYMKKFRDYFKEGPIFRVVTLLTLSGALGGLAFHLVSNQSRIEFPNVSYLGVSVAKSVAPAVNPAGVGIDDRPRSAYGDFSKHPLLAQSQAEAYERSRASREPLMVALITTIFAGVIGDLLIGIIAANAVHLLVSGLIHFEHQPDKSDGKSDGYLTRQNLTVISLGILAGFAGPKLLPEWSESMFKKTKEEIRELKQQLKEDVKQIQEEVRPQPPTTEPQATIESTSGELVTNLVWPYLKLIEVPPDSNRMRARFLADTNDPKWWSDPKVVAVRVAIRLTDEKTTPALELVEEINRGLQAPGITPDIQAALQLLAGDCHAFNRASDEALKRYGKATELTKDPWIKQIADLKSVWVEGPDGNGIAKLKDVDDVLDTEIPKDLEALFDFTRITLSLSKTMPYMDLGLGTATGTKIPAGETPAGETPAGETPDDEAPIQKAYRVYFAASVYDPGRWKKSEQIFRSYSPEAKRNEWSGRRNELLKLLSKEDTQTYPFEGELGELAAKKPDWKDGEKKLKLVVANINSSGTDRPPLSR